MAFEVITTFRYHGQPSNGTSILRIWLADKTCLVTTDGWTNYPEMELVLYPQRLPSRIVEARKTLTRQLKTARPGASLNLSAFRYILPRHIKVGDKSVPVVIRYGRWSPSLTVAFESEVVKLEAA